MFKSQMSSYGLDLAEIRERIGKTVKEAVKDLSTLTVITTTGRIQTGTKASTGEPIKVIEETGILAKTIIEIDGDITVRVPVKDEDGNEVVIDERMLELHQENVAMAVENYQIFITTVLDVSKSIVELIASL